MRKLGILLVFLAAMPMSVQAERNKGYWGLMVGGVGYEDPVTSINMTGGTFRAGYDFLPFVGVEGRMMTTTSGSQSTISELKVNYLASVLAKFTLPLTKSHRFNIYGLLGYSALKVSYNSGKEFYFTDNGLSYGMGFDFYADDLNGLNIEWASFVDHEKSGTDYSVDQIAIGYIRRF